ncbi:MAG: Peptide deformylase [Chlamydiae bacterium]|nr:Peptide deformylase [Chlamydiota bacterium]
MAKYTFRYYGDSVLREHSAPIEEITDEVKELAIYMMEYADNNRGQGMAAIQMGVPIRLFVLRDYIVLPDGQWTVSAPKVFINPKIIWKSKKTWTDTEGCMSIPNFSKGPVERPWAVKIEALDLDGNTFIDEREGLNARVSLHENDHINGVLYIDRLPPKLRKAIEPELREIKNKYYKKSTAI